MLTRARKSCTQSHAYKLFYAHTKNTQHLHIYTRINRHLRAHASLLTNLLSHTHSLERSRTRTHEHKYTLALTHTLIHTHTNTQTHTLTRTHRTHLHAHIAYSHIFTYTQIHTHNLYYMHIYTFKLRCTIYVWADNADRDLFKIGKAISWS